MLPFELVAYCVKPFLGISPQLLRIFNLAVFVLGVDGLDLVQQIYLQLHGESLLLNHL